MGNKSYRLIADILMCLFVIVNGVALSYLMYLSKNMIDIQWFFLYVLGIYIGAAGFRSCVNKIVEYFRMIKYYYNLSSVYCGNKDEYTFLENGIYRHSIKYNLDDIIKYTDIYKVNVLGTSGIDIEIGDYESTFNHISIRFKYYNGITLEDILSIFKDVGIIIEYLDDDDFNFYFLDNEELEQESSEEVKEEEVIEDEKASEEVEEQVVEGEKSEITEESAEGKSEDSQAVDSEESSEEKVEDSKSNEEKVQTRKRGKNKRRRKKSQGGVSTEDKPTEE